MNRRRSCRHPITVDIEIAKADIGRCHGYAENVSREGLSVVLWEGEAPSDQRLVMVNLKIWTGSETLFRKLQASIVRVEDGKVALEFRENDLIVHAIVQDLLYYQRSERRRMARGPELTRSSKAITGAHPVLE